MAAVQDSDTDVIPADARGRTSLAWLVLLMAAGGFALHTPDWMVGGEQSWIDQFKTGAKAAQQAMLVPFEFTQAVTDAKIHKAWHDAVDGWRTGDYEPNDVQALKTMFGFDTARAEQIVKGEAPARLDSACVRLSRLSSLGYDSARDESGGRWQPCRIAIRSYPQPMRGAGRRSHGSCCSWQ